VIERRVDYLTAYQDAGYARQYRDVVAQVRQAEAALHKTSLTEAVARNLFKLMAYKDEYEVARLHSNPEFLAKISAQFEGDFSLKFHLAPPLIASTNAKGELQKQKFGAYMVGVFGLLKHLKGLRGSALDVFGYSQERRSERRLIADYRATVTALLGKLSANNHAQALELARLPDGIKGFGHVKARHLEAVQAKWDALLAQWKA
jgi:indolepyruvate ferredoxin oxidoreductase